MSRYIHDKIDGIRTHDLWLGSQTPYFCISSVTKVENGEKEDFQSKRAKSMRFLRDCGRAIWRGRERLRV